jgi:hypothetical protein
MSFCVFSLQYMASFRWQLDPVTKLPVNVTVRANNKTIARIVGLKPFFSSAADTADSDSTIETAATAQFAISRTNVQWPLYPPGTPPPPNDKPIVGNQKFDTGNGAIQLLKADKVLLDAKTFTGDAEMPVFYKPGAAIISPPENSTGTVMPHVTLKCT